MKIKDTAAQKHGAASAEQLALMVLRGDGMTLAERKEAGRLIDAVPDLLEELQKAEDTFYDFERASCVLGHPLLAEAAQIARDSARAAIARAKSNK